MERRKQAVLLIDMQDSFVDYLPEGEADRIIRNQIKVIRRCGREGIPIGLVEYESEGRTIDSLLDEIEEIKDDTHIFYVLKHCDNAFRETELEETLRRLGIEELCLMGINASACVWDTAEDAVKKGFLIVTGPDVIADCLGVHTSESSDWYRKNGRWIVPAAAF